MAEDKCEHKYQITLGTGDKSNGVVVVEGKVRVCTICGKVVSGRFGSIVQIDNKDYTLQDKGLLVVAVSNHHQIPGSWPTSRVPEPGQRPRRIGWGAGVSCDAHKRVGW